MADLTLLTRYLSSSTSDMDRGLRELLITDSGCALDNTGKHSPLARHPLPALARLPGNVLTPLNEVTGLDPNILGGISTWPCP